MKERNLTTNQQLLLNLSASFISGSITFAINFFLSPYIVRAVGVDAYGFVGLAENFISYILLITIALNALAGRFITVYIYKNDYEMANKYYSSVFYANLFLSLAMLIIETGLWLFLERIINIPANLFWDVKILFAALFLNSILSTIGSVFTVSVFATNKLYLGSIRNIESTVVSSAILVLVYLFLPPRINYFGISSVLVTLYCTVYNLYYVKKLTPYLHISKVYFDIKAVWELIKSGVWNLITRVGQILNDGLDLLISNLFIDATAMGVLSLAKIIPTAINTMVGVLANVFSPNFTILYAKEKNDELVAAVKQSMKIMGVIVNIPVIVLIVCGEKFFTLWQPTQNAHELQILSILTIACIAFSGGINCIYSIFTVVNKLKANALVVVGGGLLSTIIVFILLKTTNLGIYAVAGVSTSISIIRNLAFTAPYGARCLKLKWYAFYPDVFKPVAFVVVTSLPCYFLNSVITDINLISLIIIGLLSLCVSIIVGYFIILNKSDRMVIFETINEIIARKMK